MNKKDEEEQRRSMKKINDKMQMLKEKQMEAERRRIEYQTRTHQKLKKQEE